MTLRIAVFRQAREVGLGAFAEPIAHAEARLTLAGEGVLALPPH
jgi:hypothetical protein